jgi:hypothetical protein
LALTAQNVTGVDRRRLYAAMGRRALRQPLSFILPVSAQAGASPRPRFPRPANRVRIEPTLGSFHFLFYRFHPRVRTTGLPRRACHP